MKIKETLYLSSWCYNSYLIIESLRKLVKKQGGEIVTTNFYKSIYCQRGEYIKIQNRSIEESIRELTETIKKAVNKDNDYYRKCVQNLENLKKIDNNFKYVKHRNYIDFILDDIYYSVSFDDNPFFDFHYQKFNVKMNDKGNYYSEYNFYSENLSKKFLENYIESYYSIGLKTKDYNKIALSLLEQLKSLRNSEVIKDKIKVNNYYDNRYHYEYKEAKRLKEYIIID